MRWKLALPLEAWELQEKYCYLFLSEPILLLSILVSQSKLQLNFSWVGIILGSLFLGALMVAVLAELARPPFDDPRTHLELTMVHEAMLLRSFRQNDGTL